MAAVGETLGIEVGLAAQLRDPLRDPVGMLLLLAGMDEEFGLHRLRVDALGHIMVALVAQDADQLGRQRLVQHLDYLLAVALVAGGDRAVLDAAARPLA